MKRNPLWTPSRRRLLQGLGAAALGLPLAVSPRRAAAASGTASRVIFFYFPDGVAGPSASGEPSLWHASGSEYSFSLPDQLEALEPWADRCVFLNGLSMGGTDSGSHPGGAKKLLTAADYGYNESIDQYLARTAGADSPWHHLYLGAMANENGASGDTHISYPVSGTSISPEDNPRAAFEALFGTATSGSSGGGGAVDPTRASVLDAALEDLGRMQSRLGQVEKEKLDYHLSSLRELESRLQTSAAVAASCDEPDIDTSGFDDSTLYEHARFPAILKAQMDLMVLAMSCGFTRVGTIQAAFHTSELIMSRFEGTEMYDPSFDMRSHQASHYGSSHDWSKREFSDYVAQRRWWVSQFAYLLEQLERRPEGDGTMLDNSILVLCTEVCDGNTHLHDNMPFILAGGGGGALPTGRLLQYADAPHGNLWVSIAAAMGVDPGTFGDRSTGQLSGLLD